MSKILKIDVNVYTPQKLKSESGGEAKLQNKSVSITENKTTIVTPDSGYDGLNRVEVSTNVPNNPNWTEIGYEDIPDAIIDGFNYAKQIKDNWDSSRENISNMFNNDTNLLILPNVDTSNATNFNSFCRDARGLVYVPELDTRNAINFDNAFASVAVSEFSFTDTSKVTNFNTAFGNNKVLVSAPDINTESATSLNSMFKDCSNLQNVKVYDLSSATSLNSMFSSCSNLSNDSLNNIMEMLIGATSYTGTKKLKQIGLSSSQATTCQTLSNWNDLVNAGWTTGY